MTGNFLEESILVVRVTVIGESKLPPSADFNEEVTLTVYRARLVKDAAGFTTTTLSFFS
jgi:hypothetical protein